jgi:glycosyltransferase involved in cell wall biosynthesis
MITPWPLATVGGGQRLSRQVATALADHHAIEVVVAAGSGLAHGPTSPMSTPQWRERRLPLDRDRLVGLEAVAEETQPDAVLFTSHHSGCAWQAGALATGLDIPFLLWPSIHLDVRTHVSRTAQRLYRSASMVLCLSDLERQWLLSAGVPADRAVVVGYGWSASEVATTRCRFPSEPGEVRLLTVGACVPHKQLDHQLLALACLRRKHGVNARLTIAGPASDTGMFTELVRQVDRLGLGGSVDLKTDCTDEEIAALHASADCFLFTSRSESFGIALFEAIGWGTLPCVYPHPVYRQHVEACGYGFVAPRADPTALADTIVQALRRRETVSDDVRSARLATRSWDRVVAPIAELLSRPREARGN